MIDLSRNRKPETGNQKWEPEEIAVAALAVAIWAAIIFGILGGL